jgi:hypothetical protein
MPPISSRQKKLIHKIIRFFRLFLLIEFQLSIPLKTTNSTKKPIHMPIFPLLSECVATKNQKTQQNFPNVLPIRIIYSKMCLLDTTCLTVQFCTRILSILLSFPVCHLFRYRQFQGLISRDCYQRANIYTQARLIKQTKTGENVYKVKTDECGIFGR